VPKYRKCSVSACKSARFSENCLVVAVVIVTNVGARVITAATATCLCPRSTHCDTVAWRCVTAAQRLTRIKALKGVRIQISKKHPVENKWIQNLLKQSLLCWSTLGDGGGIVAVIEAENRAIGRNSKRALVTGFDVRQRVWSASTLESSERLESYLRILRKVNSMQQNFPFMWPRCIVTNFFIIKPTRRTNFPNILRHETLRVSGSSSAHHQEFIHCTLCTGICHACLKTAFEQDQDCPARKLSYAAAWAYLKTQILTSGFNQDQNVPWWWSTDDRNMLEGL
jgi:hypothetical protein